MPNAFDMNRIVTLAALTGFLAASGASAASAQSARQGEALVTRDCAMCHAVNRQGLSQNRRAPPLRELPRRMSPEVLRQQLTSGITAGHPEMPRFRFSAGEVDAIMAYIQAIQDE